MGVWVFGYGSLIWRPGFQYFESSIATLHGWTRAFQQASPDHRGTPQRPGRVLTLSQNETSHCVGRAFCVAASEWPNIFAYLEKRESGGYRALELEIELPSNRQSAWTWIALPDNPHFVSDETVTDTIDVMYNAHGESGPNIDYVLRLDEALLEAGIDDEQVARYANLLRMRKLKASSH